MNTGNTLLAGTGIHANVDDKALLSDIDITLSKNELVGLVGPNGAGKSTLLNVLAGLREPEQGSISLLDKPLNSYNASHRAQLVSWLAQQGEVHWPIVVHRLVSLGLLPHHKSWNTGSASAKDAITKAMRETDCQHLAERQYNTLSGGEQARVLIARALAAEPTILLADEPIASLDPGHQLQTMQLLRRFASDSKGCVVVLHDLSLAMRYCDTLCLLDKGKLVKKGTPAEVLTDENLQEVYGVKALRGEQPAPWLVPYDLSD